MEEREHMKPRLNSLLTVAIALIPLLTACRNVGTPSVEAADDTKNSIQTQRVDRGRYLVTAIGCNDCHTPLIMTERGPEPDMTRMLSGHPSSLRMPRPPKLAEGPWGWAGASTNTSFAGPWGVTFAANLTPDQNS